MNRRSRLWAAAAVLVAAAVAGLVVLAGQWESLSVPGAEPVVIADAVPTQLDTLTFQRRPVIASLSGVVVQVGPDETVWLERGGDAFPVSFPEPPGLAVEDRALVVGRLRSRGGQRWLDVDAWSVVEPFRW